MAVDFLGRFDGQVARVFVNNACDISASAARAIAVFPNACRDSFHRFRGNCFHAADPTERCWRNNVRYSSLVPWESAGAQAGNIDHVPCFLAPDSAASDYFDGHDIGAFAYVGVSVEDGLKLQASRCKRGPSIMRGVLLLTGSSGESRGTSRLLDATGRQEMELRSGPNDVRAPCPGVNFVRDEARVADQRPDAVRKAVTF